MSLEVLKFQVLKFESDASSDFDEGEIVSRGDAPSDASSNVVYRDVF